MISLELLEPSAEAELMRAAGPGEAVFVGKDVAIDGKIAAVIAARETNLSLRVGGGAATDNDGADAKPGEEAGDTRGGSAGSELTGEVVGSAGEAEARGVDESRREDVSFFGAEDLLAKSEDIGAIGIGGSGGVGGAVVDSVDGSE